MEEKTRACEGVSAKKVLHYSPKWGILIKSEKENSYADGKCLGIQNE
jgi:hypothetical protein